MRDLQERLALASVGGFDCPLVSLPNSCTAPVGGRDVSAVSARLRRSCEQTKLIYLRVSSLHVKEICATNATEKRTGASSAPSTLFKAPVYLDCCQVSSILASGLRPCFRCFLLMQCNEWLFCMREQHISDQYQTRRTSPTGQDVCVRRVCTFKHI